MRYYDLVMSDEELLKAFKKWKERAGRARALSELTIREVNPRTADLLASDDYNQSPRRKLRRALEEIVRMKAS